MPLPIDGSGGFRERDRRIFSWIGTVGGMLGAIKQVYHTVDRETEALSKLLDQAVREGAQSLLILACDNNDLQAESVDPLLKACPLPVFGGIFPELLHNRSHFAQGYLVCAFDVPLQVQWLQDLELDEAAVERCVSELKRLDAQQGLLCLVDGLSSRIDHFLNALYSCLGPSVPVLGGGAGSLSFQKRPCIFTNEGLKSDCAQLVKMPDRLDVRVRHGWEKLAGPFLVTESEGNTVHSLNFQPALQVYREAVAPYTELDFEQHDFFSIAKTFPFGMERLDDEVLVRDPIVADEQSLVCVGEVPVNTLIYVLRGNPQTLIRAAGELLNDEIKEAYSAQALFFDCISRCLFLGTEFAEELDAVHSRLPESGLMVGALTLGEIANTGGGLIQFHNKTAVMGVMQSGESDIESNCNLSDG